MKAICKVTVKAPLKWIVLNTSTGIMRIGRKKQLEVIYEPDNTTDDASEEGAVVYRLEQDGTVTDMSAAFEEGVGRNFPGRSRGNSDRMVVFG